MRKAQRERIERLRRRVEELWPGRLLAGQYLVLEKAGSGAEGVVYLVRDQFTRTERALKFYYDPESIRHVTRVANKMSNLHHDGIIRHFGVGHVRMGGEQVLFLIMEAYDGVVLSDYQNEFPGRRLGLFESLKYFADVMRALEYAHGRGYVHGDIHRENVVLDQTIGWPEREHVARLNDFFPTGSSRRPAERQVDIREAGFLLYEMLTGKMDYATRHLKRLPPECADLIRHCIHPNRRRRYSDARQVMDALRRMQWV